jgi:hypothetical protein
LNVLQLLPILGQLAAIASQGKKDLAGKAPKADTLIYLALRTLAKQYESRNSTIHNDAGFIDKIGA